MLPSICTEIEATVIEQLGLDDVEIVREGTRAWEDRSYDRRRAPSAVALSTLVEARNRLDALRAALPECLVLGDPQVSRVEMPDGKYTAVTISVTSQAGVLPESVVEIGVES